ncbi:restriction endonuclease [Blastococcus sp. SYSU DS0510]
MPGKNPELLPTPSLSWEEFEDFTERLLSAHRFCPEPLRHVVRVERWGRRGDKQDGIDFEGDFSDGASASWQCKRQDTLTPGDVRAAVNACTFEADVHHLVFSGEASRDARDEMAKYSNWELLDQRGLGRLLHDLPLHKQRDVLDATWGVAVRRMLLEVPGEDAFLSLDTFAADRRDPNTVLNDLGPRVGREAELEALGAALNRSGDWPAVVMVTGPGGRGKTRLLVEGLAQFQDENRQIAVVCLSPGRAVDAAALGELPQTPAVIVVDDAHQDPSAIAPLLQYARNVDGTQLVLSSRPSGTRALRVQIANARYRLNQIATVEVGELGKPQARALVDSVTEGFRLQPAAREYFAGQAVHSPHVAVIAADLIRRGELTAPVVVDPGLREEVLARYEELAAREIDGVPGDTVRRLLAVYAGLGPVDDADLRGTIAEFCDLTLVELLRLRQGLHDRGVLVTRGGLTRVVPDVLADDILEREAAVGTDATGFAEDLWNAFSATHAERLVIALAELDWRLTQRGGPSVFGSVWAYFQEGLNAANFEDLEYALKRLSGLTSTQPLALVEFLDGTRARLDHMEATVALPPWPPDSSWPVPDGEEPLWWRRPTNADDVRRLMPELYGQCAASAPELLETVLDALWALRRRDTRPTNQHPGHAERVIVDRLANLGDLPDLSFPERIVDRVKRWLAEPATGGAARSPLFALRPLLAKEAENHITETRRQLILRSFPVSPDWSRTVRDAIRATLRDLACGTDVGCAAAAIDLLGDALRPPPGLYGRTASRDEVLAWDGDDLATLAVLQHVADATTSGVVRRLIRKEIAWTAERALSLPLRHAALTLVTALDEHDDDLIELLLHQSSAGEPTRRGVPVPTLQELQEAEAASAERDAAMSNEERECAHSARIRGLVDRKQSFRQELAERVVSDLAGPEDPGQIVATLDETGRQIRAALPDHRLTFWSIWRQLGLTRPNVVPGTVLAIASGAPGPLDEGLDQLLNAWADHDEAGLIDFLTHLAEQRKEVRLAVATAFVNYGWTDRGERLIDVYSRGTLDTEPEVRDRFLMGAHRLLATAPAETAASLLAQDISPFAATRALEQACGYDGASWGRQLGEHDAQAVLDLVAHAGWQDYTLQQLVSAIARAHPLLVLDRLLTAHRAGQLPSEVDGLAAALDDQAEALVQWLLDQAHEGAPPESSAVVGLVMERVTDSQAQRLVAASAAVDRAGLLGLSALLRDVSTWPLRQPWLARHLISKAREKDSDAAASVRADIAAAMHLGTYGSVNGVSEELNSGVALATACAEAETDVELREDFENARARFEQNAAWLLRRNAEDDEEE